MSEFKYSGPGWYKMRNGQKAWMAGEIPVDCKTSDGYKYVGIDNDGYSIVWRLGGFFIDDEQNVYDLIGPWAEPKLWYVNVFKDGSGKFYTSRKRADTDALLMKGYAPKERIACVKVTEGQFDD